jgi:Flp pilus assembly protein TadD
MQRAESADPLSLIINAELAELLLITHRVDQSIDQSRKTIEMDGNFSIAHNQLGAAYLEQRRGDGAIAELEKAVQLSSGNPTCTANLARAYAAAGRTSDALRLAGELKQPRRGYSNASEIAMVYAALGDSDQAMAWLTRAYGERFNPSVLLRPGFDPLRADRRFQDLESRVNVGR